MTDDEMNRLAEIIVDKMFERQAELDEEFMAEWQTQILIQTEMPNLDDELKRLEEMWRQRWCWRWRWRRAGVVWCGRGGGDGNIISGLSVISNALALRLRCLF